MTDPVKTDPVQTDPVATDPAGAGTAIDALIPVPSGQDVRLLDVIHDAPGSQGLTVRFRFLAPAIADGGGVDFETAAVDMQHLCDTYALPRVLGGGPMPAQIIVSLSNVAVEFGQADPAAKQFFEAYSIQDNTCIWEPF